MSKRVLLFCGFVAALAGGAVYAGTVLEFDAADANTPLLASPPWIAKGEAMENREGRLVQHADNLTQEGGASYYLSPALGGLLDGAKDYGIEFRVRPLGDIRTAGNSVYANLVVAWGNGEHSYDLSINRSSRDEPDGSGETAGELNGGGNRQIKVAEGIDWSKPHTVFIGYRAADKTFAIFVDGDESGSFPAEQISFDPAAEFADHVAFGDTTSGQGGDIGAEWYFLRVRDSATPNRRP